jgi:hypothetical protein
MAYRALTTSEEKLINRLEIAFKRIKLGTWLKELFSAPTITSPEIAYSTASHSYASAAADWTLTAAEAKCRYLKVTLASAAVNAIIPAASTGKEFVVVNGSGQALTVKAPTGTGITVASGKAAIVYFDGTNVVRVTADA